MSKKVRLTWVASTGETIVEDCFLLAEEDVLHTINGMKVTTDIFDNMSKQGLVVFEDDNGVFGLPPLQIRKVETL